MKVGSWPVSLYSLNDAAVFWSKCVHIMKNPDKVTVVGYFANNSHVWTGEAARLKVVQADISS